MSLAESFAQYFDILYATTPEQKSLAFKIRYRVYCLEFGYEAIENFDNEEESDSFDDISLHCVIIHKSTNIPAGCVRLVPTLDGMKLPFEAFCLESLDNEYIASLDLKRDEVCEISRLAVDGAFRRRANEARTRFGEIDAIDCSHHERRTFPLISVAAFLAATALTDLTHRRSVFAMMEPFLPRMLQKSGIPFDRAGSDIDYHGIRAPYFSRTELALSNMHPELKELYQYVYDEISTQYHSSALVSTF